MHPLSHHPRNAAWLMDRAGDVVFQIANRRRSDIARPHIGPGAAAFLALAGKLTVLARRIGRHVELPVVAAETVNLELDRALGLRATRIYGQSPLQRLPLQLLVRTVRQPNFRLRIGVCCSIFTLPLWSSPLADFLLWQIRQN